MKTKAHTRYGAVRSLQQFRLAVAQQSLSHLLIQGLDLRQEEIDWQRIDVADTVFLGCQFRTLEDECVIRARGGHLFNFFSNLPYNPYRTKLYTPEELMEGYIAGARSSLDERIYQHFLDQGAHDPDIAEALAQRFHDYSIEIAVKELLGVDEKTGLPSKKTVGFMGGHAKRRDDPFYEKTAKLARLATREGYFVVTGGGPGIMEAANLGAYLAGEEEEALLGAIELLKEHPKFAMSDGTLSAESIATTQRILEMFPKGHESLSIPTWFYGHEPVNLFGSHIGKYFSNSLREDGLLAISHFGIVYAPGGACTIQEIFTDAAQNHYGTFGWRSPMVFLGSSHYLQSQVYSCLTQQAAGQTYAQLISISDEPEELLDFLRKHPPIAVGK